MCVWRNGVLAAVLLLSLSLSLTSPSLHTHAQVLLTEAEDLTMLLNLLWTEFHHVLKDTKQHRYSSQAHTAAATRPAPPQAHHPPSPFPPHIVCYSCQRGRNPMVGAAMNGYV